MEQISHLSEEQFANYHGRKLAPADLLAIGDHIAECEECRNRLYERERAAGQLREWKTDFSRHLEYAEVVSLVEGTGSPESQQHVHECALCRAEVEDLRRFRSDLTATRREPIQMPARSPRRWMAIAAAVVLAALGTWRLVLSPTTQKAPAPPQIVANAVPVEAALTPEQRQAVDRAMASRQLPRPAVLDQVLSHRGVLLGGGTEQSRFEVAGPIGTAVISDTPAFRWTALAGAAYYTVSVFDDNFNPVATSPHVEGTEWLIDKPLARGHVYVWQVAAHAGAKVVNAPVPPAPEAKFQVLPADSANQIETARKVHPANHLLLAVLDAQAGALDDVSAELDALAQSDAALANSLRESLKKLRP